jgi:hypothetical protein
MYYHYCFNNKVYCGSPECKNDCDNQLTEEIKELAEKADMPIAKGYYCGLPPYSKPLCK